MEQTTKQLQELLQSYLPSHKLTYCEVDEQEILGLKFKSAGVSVKLDSGTEFFGASSSESLSPLIFAGYECLERYAILNQPKTIDANETMTYRNALSNGVAFHKTIEEASKNAFLELAERNEILKSWFYNTPIRFLSNEMFGEISNEMKTCYEFFIVDFSSIEGLSVVGIFAFPKKTDVNLVYGFGSEYDLDLAIKKAKKEFTTRLGFLWGETHDEEYSNRNSSTFHQEFYLRKENEIHIRNWLFEPESKKQRTSKFQLKNISYVNITPSEWDLKFNVIKAMTKDSISLFFGLPPKHLFDFPFRSEVPHPIV